MRSIHRYYVAGDDEEVEIPPEVVEITLMENFHWTPNQIDEIPFVRIQEYFMILNQKRITLEQKTEFAEKNKLQVDDEQLKGLRLHKNL